MKTELRIPSRLFLAAGKAVEDALREATFEALIFDDLSYPFATWEDGKIVIVYSGTALGRMLAQSVSSSSSGEPKEKLISRRDEMFLNIVFGSALQIYIEDERLHIEFPYQREAICDFLENPENEDVLRNICRDITGREMTARLMIVEDQTRYRELSLDSRRLAEDVQKLIDTLRKIGDWLLVARVEALQNRLGGRQPDSSPDSLRAPRTLPIEGDDLTSHKSE